MVQEESVVLPEIQDCEDTVENFLAIQLGEGVVVEFFIPTLYFILHGHKTQVPTIPHCQECLYNTVGFTRQVNEVSITLMQDLRFEKRQSILIIITIQSNVIEYRSFRPCGYLFFKTLKMTADLALEKNQTLSLLHLTLFLMFLFLLLPGFSSVIQT